ncbi:hypothetical protein [Pelagibacterium lacus]|uniref:1,4-alpha-glucan branching enzyme n=1 Tax=Pelagibacterium lacus TaxID=2282655 RepID=A0A369W6M7_9HYPH|nr:hypothetical protein [Pelagibacterium lacus]RDE09659.1 hypothetical protein DVH29_05750 [Pelagibacterium lacus]
MASTLTTLEDIRTWTQPRGGNPIMADMPEPNGTDQHLLGLTFDQHMLNADANEGPDRPGSHFELVDWESWYAAFQAQDLVLVVDDDLEGDTYADYRFMSRSEAEKG